MAFDASAAPSRGGDWGMEKSKSWNRTKISLKQKWGGIKVPAPLGEGSQL